MAAQHNQPVQPARVRRSPHRSSRARTDQDAGRCLYELTAPTILSLSQTLRAAAPEAAVSPHVAPTLRSAAWRRSCRSGQKTCTTSSRRNEILGGGVIVWTQIVERSSPCRPVAVLHE